MNKDRLEQLWENALEYLVELKDHDSIEDKKIFLEDILGMTEEEIKYFGLDIDFLR